MPDEKSIVDALLETSKITQKHGNNMYKIAIKHAVSMIEIDAVLGLERLKEELAELEKEEK